MRTKWIFLLIFVVLLLFSSIPSSNKLSIAIAVKPALKLSSNDGNGQSRLFARVIEYENYTTLYVPFHFQETSMSCGEAALRMLLHYYGVDIPEKLLGQVANLSYTVGTYNLDLVRAAQFSYMSTAVQNESLKGYPQRKIGFPVYHTYGLTINDLKNLIDRGYPVLVLTKYSQSGYGHFRIVKGYNDINKTLFVHDPWFTSYGYQYSGPNEFFSYNEFYNLWEYSAYWGMVIADWNINHTIEQISTTEIILHINISYPLLEPFNPAQYPVKDARINITLPQGFSTTNATSYIFDEVFVGGESVILNFIISTPSEFSENDTIKITTYGYIEGSSTSYSYYKDAVGSIKEIKLINYISPKVKTFNYTFASGILNLSFSFWSSDSITGTLIWNIMDAHDQYRQRALSLHGDTLFSNISFEHGGLFLELFVKLVDTYGNSQISRGILLYLFDSPPNIKLQQDLYMIKKKQASLNISWVAHDDFDIAYAEVFLNNSLLGTTQEESYMLNLSEGYWIVKIVVYDSVGNKNSTICQIYLDATPPEIISNIKNDSLLFEYVDINIIFEDLLEVNVVEASLDRKQLSTSDSRISFSGFIAPGDHTLKIIVEDSLGNLAKYIINFRVLPAISLGTVIITIAGILFFRRMRK